MRTALALILLGGALLAAPEPRFSVVDDWEVHGDTLVLGCIGWPIRLANVARRLEIKEDAARDYLKGLDTRRPLLLEQDPEGAVVGLWSLTEERLRKQLRLELTSALEVRLVNAGKWTHRVVKPNDGSESGWREPEIYFEREVDGKWVRGGKPGRCGMFASDWQKDIIDLKPGDTLVLEGYLPLDMSFGLTKPGKAKLRAVYVYAGGFVPRDPDGKLDPGPMGKTPAFTLVSEPVVVEIP